MKSKNTNKNKYKNICCSKCSSKNFKKNGKRKTEDRGLIQRYKCKNCNYRFTHDDGFFRMRNHPNKITCAIDLFYKGISTMKIQEHFKSFYPKNSSNKSVYLWIIKYANMISQYTENLALKTGNEIQVDEMEYTRRKDSLKKGVSNEWFIDSIDTQTRYMISSKYVDTYLIIEIHC